VPDPATPTAAAVRVPIHGLPHNPSYLADGAPPIGHVVVPASCRPVVGPYKPHGHAHVLRVALGRQDGPVRGSIVLGAWEALAWARRGQEGFAWEPTP
jgi:hypothetical protein